MAAMYDDDPNTKSPLGLILIIIGTVAFWFGVVLLIRHFT